jgi:small subunit ribosomal protein S17
MAEEEDKSQQEEPEAESEEQAQESEASAEEAAEAPAEEQSEEAPAEEAPAAESTEAADEAEPEDGGEPAAQGEPPSEDDETGWKARRRLERSRLQVEPRPQRSPEERQAERQQRRGAKAVARRRHRASRRSKKGGPSTGTPPTERRPNPAKVRQGVVVSDGADKTITVRIDIARRHPTYEKVVRRSRTLRAHDEANEAGAGDVVRVVETRPISRSKRWRLVEIVEKAR